MAERYSKQTTLESRISDALHNTNATAAALAKLLTETEISITAAEQKAARLRIDAFDPYKYPDAKVARQLLEDAQFECNRLQTMRPWLQQRLSTVAAAEEHDAWLADYAERKIERDETADELAKSYPGAQRFAAAVARCVALDAKLSELHQKRPAGEKLHLDSAELVARNLSAFSRDIPSFKDALVIPAWQGGDNLWPIKTRLDPALFGIQDGRRFDGDCSADW
jgi:hypothetical protein